MELLCAHILFSYCQNIKLPQTYWLKTTHIYYVIVLIFSQKFKLCQQSCVLCGDSLGEFLLFELPDIDCLNGLSSLARGLHYSYFWYHPGSFSPDPSPSASLFLAPHHDIGPTNMIQNNFVTSRALI